MIEEGIITQEFNGSDRQIEGMLCRIYKVPPAEVTFLHNANIIEIHLSISLFRQVGNDGIDERDIIKEELIGVEGISSLDVHAAIIYVQSSILFDYSDLKYRILLALKRAFETIASGRAFDIKHCGHEGQ